MIHTVHTVHTDTLSIHSRTRASEYSEMLLSLIKRLINLELKYALKTFLPYNTIGN
jgi:hypothetical protein